MMCGFFGIINRDGIQQSSWVNAGLNAIKHRGPDDSGWWMAENSQVAFFHRRLSVIDLSVNARQPMLSSRHNLVIVFNGEIYNYLELKSKLSELGYTFSSNSDTEVLLVAYTHWGTNCLNYLNGMFSFALFDINKNIVFFARDRSGEKPFFYRIDGSSINFSSELKAILENKSLPRIINNDSLDSYLMSGFVPGELCILDGYNKLPPAHAMIFDIDSGQAEIWRYWSPPEYSASFPLFNEHDLIDELEFLLDAAVGRQLAADVPVGVLLSGGVDSSLITALAVRHSANVRTFNVSFPGHGQFDEAPHSRLISRYFGTEHIELSADPVSADLILKLTKQFDEPVADSSLIPTYLVAHLVREYCTVALGGDGGDELFGGYNHYSRLLWMQSRFRFLPSFIRKGLSKLSESVLPVGFKGKNYLQSLAVNLDSELPLIATLFDRSTRKKLMHGHAAQSFDAEDFFMGRTPINDDLLQRATRMDFENYLPEDILVKVDRSSMLNSLEMRAPFLDRDVVEFAFGKVPSLLKATAAEKKIILKRLAARLLPSEFDMQRKQGFSIPINDWLKRGPFRDLFWDVLTSGDCYFDRKTVNGLLVGQDRGRSNGERLFALVQFELWRREYQVGF